MSYVVVSCPKCQRDVLLDEVDGKGFCMYCGSDLDTTRDKTLNLPSMFEEAVGGIIDMAKETDFSSEPWYGELDGVRGPLTSGDYNGAAEALVEMLEGRDPETRDRIRQAVLVELLNDIIEGTTNGDPYESGLVELAGNVCPETEEDAVTPSELMLGILDGIDGNGDLIADEVTAYGLTATAFHILRDVLWTDHDIYDQGMALRSFLHISEDALDFMEECTPDSDAIGAVESMYNAASCIYEAMNDRMMRTTDETADEAVEANGKSWELGPVVSEILTRVESEGFDPTDEFWDRMESDSEDYLRRYFSD